MNTLGERIKKARGKEARESFSKLVGVSHATLKRYEYGQYEPDDSFLTKLAQIRGVSLNWLMTGEGHMIAEVEEKQTSPPSQAESVPEKAEAARTDVRDEYITCLRQLADLQKENGDLRVKAAQLETRIAELERQLAEALKPARNAPMGNGISKAG